jgi:hypothetical protein
MTRIENAGLQTLRPAWRRALLGCATAVALVGFGGSAFADHHDDHHWHGHAVYHHWHHWDHRYYGGYYPAPPVVYGSPYYEPPPVVYRPGFGVNIHIP